MFSLFESILKTVMRWDDPLIELDKYLRNEGNDYLADRIIDYMLAINVLKHGHGRSYDKLQSRPNLEFKVLPEGDQFFSEGDVSEVNVLVPGITDPRSRA